MPGIAGQPPRKGDVRTEWMADQDALDRYLFTGGQWRLQGRTHRGGSPEASTRAETLLLSHLDAKQKADYQERGWFDIVGGTSKRTYRIKKGAYPTRNVTWLDGRVSYCAFPNPNAGLPIGDALLAQKLMLESAEGEAHFTKIACHDGYAMEISYERYQELRVVAPPPPRPWKTVLATFVLIAACTAVITAIFH